MLTLRGLKNMAETAPPGQKTPTARELFHSEADRGKENWGKYRDSSLSERLCCLSHGQGRNRVPYPCMQRNSYDFCSSSCDIGSGAFDGEPWYLRFVLEGEDRLFRNLAPGSRTGMYLTSLNQRNGANCTLAQKAR